MKINSKKLALFDFDGTLTTRDSLIDFIWYSFGPIESLRIAAILIPTLILYYARIISNSNAKERVIYQYISGTRKTCFDDICRRYATNRLPMILRTNAIERLTWHIEQGHSVAVVTASPEAWIKPWTDDLGITLIATNLEERDGSLTGKFAGKNCHGLEKVHRITSHYQLESFEYIYAYGDSSGDKPMLQLADEPYFRSFTTPTQLC